MVIDVGIETTLKSGLKKKTLKTFFLQEYLFFLVNFFRENDFDTPLIDNCTSKRECQN